MNPFLSAIFAVAFFLTNVFVMPVNSPAKFANPVFSKSSDSNICSTVVDDEPIIMRSRIKSTGGKAISGASVSLTLDGESEPAFSGITDESGECVFDSVHVGYYQLNISKSGFVPVQTNLVLSENTLQVDTLVEQ